MLNQIYSTTFNVSDIDYKYKPGCIFKLIRIEFDSSHNILYVFSQTLPDVPITYFYTRLSRDNILQFIIMEYYNTINTDNVFIDMSFTNSLTSLGSMNITCIINTDLILINQNNIALHSLCSLLMTKNYKTIDSWDISNKLQLGSFLPENRKSNIFRKKGFNVKLFDYQKNSIIRMAEIEQTNIVERKIKRTFELDFGDITIIWDPFNNKIVNTHKFCTIESNGGILADGMGIGKTLTMIGLMYYNQLSPIVQTPDFIDNLLYSKATLVIVPSHLSKQWVNEYNKAIPDNGKPNRIITILTKTQHVKVTYLDFINADIIIVSQQFLMNFKNYIEINYRKVSPSTYSSSHRLEIINNVFRNWVNTNQDIMSMTQPLFEFFHFNRIIIDEGHEIFERELGNISLNRWLYAFLIELKGTYKWYVSGTPFTRNFISCCDYIGMKLKFDSETIIVNNLVKYKGCMVQHDIVGNNKISNVCNFIMTEEFIDNIMKAIIIRHRKEDIEDIIKIPGYNETIIWVKLTEAERSIYDSKKHISSKITLQQLCCHPLIVDSMRKIIGSDNMVDLDKVQETLIAFHMKQIVTYTDKITTLDKTNQAYHMVLANYNSKISESNFMLNILNKINSSIIQDNKNESDVTCVICFSNIDMNNNNVLTACGHLYCYDCITTSIKYKAECPTCKNKLDSSLYKIKKLTNDKEIVNNNPLICKYGAKLGTLIQMIKTIMIQNDTNKIIIFSQWDDMLSLIGKSLLENNIKNSFIKGNVHCRTNAISRFTNVDNDYNNDLNRVIMLSLKNSASGTNLTQATHIFFVEPINLSRDECKMIEGQAIGRACRLGQKNVIEVIRILCEDTIEEEIYNNVYNNINV